MSLSKEGQNLLFLHYFGSVGHICTLGYSDSLTPHRWSRRNGVSNFENEINSSPVKGENRVVVRLFSLSPACKPNTMKKTS